MEKEEEIYRNTSNKNKKYKEKLYDYIRFLLKNERILEANYYLKKCSDDSFRNRKFLVLGYEIAIKNFDNEGIRFFDNELVKDKYPIRKLFLLRLKYYFSVQNRSCFDSTLGSLLCKMTISKDELQTIVDLVYGFESYNSISSLHLYLRNKKVRLNDLANKKAKKVVLQKLVEQICKVVK